MESFELDLNNVRKISLPKQGVFTFVVLLALPFSSKILLQHRIFALGKWGRIGPFLKKTGLVDSRKFAYCCGRKLD
jgi:hypothetical protein